LVGGVTTERQGIDQHQFPVLPVMKGRLGKAAVVLEKKSLLKDERRPTIDAVEVRRSRWVSVKSLF
jgi:hypothetical protein